MGLYVPILANLRRSYPNRVIATHVLFKKAIRTSKDVVEYILGFLVVVNIGLYVVISIDFLRLMPP